MADHHEDPGDCQVTGQPDAAEVPFQESTSGAPLAELHEITKRFPGVTALDQVSLQIRPQEVVGLVGQNGSGKSTLLKILAGIHHPDGGEIRLRGEPTVLRNPGHARTAGIGMVFQEQSLLPNLTVAENIALGAENLGSQARGFYRWGSVRRLAQQQLDKIGSTISPRALVSALSQLERQTVELAKVLTTELYAPANALVMLDEPTSTLSRHEIDVLFGEIRRLREHSSVIFVSHRLDEILEISDRVYVLRDGKCVAERSRGSWHQDEFFRLMIGRESARDYFGVENQKPYSGGVVRLNVQSLEKAGAYRDVSFELHPGEVLGICGVEGSGREKVLRTIFGAEYPDSGRILLDGKQLPLGSSEEAVRCGIGYIPAERSVEAALMEMEVGENITIAHLDQVTRGPVLSKRNERRLAGAWVERLRVKTPSIRAMMSTLSGGNQQKVVFARWLLSPDIRLLLLDHPTRGLDIGAKAEVYEIIRESASSGTTIILVSDSLEETIALSHNILVMKDGLVRGSLPAPAHQKPSQLEIVEKML
jgi:ribose transport system ATP-binding protein